MQGFKTDYVNLIADNLRDRYDNGFPILKELIQNADDAKARTLIFGRHPGFPDSPHPLLQGSGLWFFNDGEFKERDAENFRSFGFNSKAGDAGAIGKFGLGMKNVFYLCEALSAHRVCLIQSGVEPSVCRVGRRFPTTTPPVKPGTSCRKVHLKMQPSINCTFSRS